VNAVEPEPEVLVVLMAELLVIAVIQYIFFRFPLKCYLILHLVWSNLIKLNTIYSEDYFKCRRRLQGNEGYFWFRLVWWL
jgi:hypothetical protein